MVRLSKRLSLVASFVKKGEIVADIGTDHGYIPAYLIENGICEKAYASDIREGPLSNAIETAKRFGVSEKITFVCADGICGIEKGSVDTVIIAGMGGEMIVKILASSPWATEKGMHLILQPQSKMSELFEYLKGKCFLQNAALVVDEGRLYQVLEYFGGEGEDILPESVYIKNHDPLLERYLDTAIVRLKTANEGLSKSENCGEQIEKNNTLIREYERMKGEISW